MNTVSVLMVKDFYFPLICSVMMEKEHHLKAQAFQRAELFRLIELYLLKLGNRSTCGVILFAVYILDS